jgi:trans-aconitate methyltransferase
MRFTDIEPAYQVFVRDLLERSHFDPEAFHMEIPAGDEMFNGVLPGYPGRPGGAFHRYFESALRTFHVYEQLVGCLGGFGALERVLDFGSGHGRLTRPLVHRLEPRRIWVCDIYPEAVAWQAETFGVNGLVSVTDPDRFGLRDAHDLVFVASVFSHLPDGLFQRWLRRLYDVVTPGGMLAFSVHDATFAPEGQDIADTGIGYARHSESATLDAGIYGMSYVTPDYVAAAIATACGADATARSKAFPRALFESQDLYVVGKGDMDIASLVIRATPLGGFASARAKQVWQGWGFDPNPGAQIVRADFYVGDRRAASMTPTADNSEVMRYFPGAPNIAVRWTFDDPGVAPDVPLRVELVSSTGAVGHCYAMIPADAPETVARP